MYGHHTLNGTARFNVLYVQNKRYPELLDYGFQREQRDQWVR